MKKYVFNVDCSASHIFEVEAKDYADAKLKALRLMLEELTGDADGDTADEFLDALGWDIQLLECVPEGVL